MDTNDHLSTAIDDATGASVPTATEERGRWSAVWSAIGTAVTGLLGLAPHVLHHIGLVAGAFLVTGATGNILFGLLGLGLSIPFLVRLYRRHRTWKAPALAVTIFAVVFSLSAFVVGPAITNGSSEPASPTQPAEPDQHSEHHGE